VEADGTAIWIQGQINFHPHDVVDSAAKHAATFNRITGKSSLPAYDYRNHYYSLIFEKWHSILKNQHNNKST